MATKTNIGLVEYAKAQLGLPYWYGTYGQTASSSLYGSKKKQYPSYYTANDFPKQYGKRVHDCIGLIKGYLWSDSPTAKPKYKAAEDTNAGGMLSRCKEKGAIGTMPELPGVLVFMSGHVGVYIGNGYVIEARGHSYGVVKTALKDRPWKNWGKCPYIEYAAVKPVQSVESTKTDNKPTQNKNSLKEGTQVKITGKYASSSTAKTAENSKSIGTTAYIVEVYEGRAFPYQLGKKKGDKSSKNTIGFANADAISEYKAAVKKTPTIGAKVKITKRYASSSVSKLALNSKAKGKTAYIVNIYEGRLFPYQLGTKKGDKSSANTIGFAKGTAFELV